MKKNTKKGKETEVAAEEELSVIESAPAGKEAAPAPRIAPEQKHGVARARATVTEVEILEAEEEEDAPQLARRMLKRLSARTVRWIFCAAFTVGLGALLSITIVTGVSIDYNAGMILLFILSAIFAIPEFWYLLTGRPFLLLEFVQKKNAGFTAEIAIHILSVTIAYGAILFQFALR